MEENDYKPWEFGAVTAARMEMEIQMEEDGYCEEIVVLPNTDDVETVR